MEPSQPAPSQPTPPTPLAPDRRENRGGSHQAGARAAGTLSSWQRLLLALLLLGAALHTARPLWNGDTFWHFSSGHLYLEVGGLPEHDPFTYTAGGRTWVHHEWLSQIVMAVVEGAVGLGGSRLFRSTLATLGLALLFVVARRRIDKAAGDAVGGAVGGAVDGTATGAAAIGVLVFGAAGLLPNASLRPHLVAWPLVVLVLAWIAPVAVESTLRARRLPVAAILALALGAVLWVNLHSSALILPLLLGASTAGAAFDRLFRRRPGWRPALGLAALATLTGVACLVQPAGLELFHYALETPDVNVRSEEWAPLLSAGTWRGTPATLLAWLALASSTILLALRERLGRGDADRVGISLAFPDAWAAVACLVLALEHRRMTLFLFVPALYVASRAAPLAGEWLGRAGERIRPPIRLATRLVVVAAVASWALSKVPDAVETSPLRRGFFPVAAADVLSQAEIEGRLFHDINWGGYLGYRRHPAQQVFADGRWLLAGPQAMVDLPRLYFRDLPAAELEDLYAYYEIEVLVQPTRDLLRLPGVDPARWRLAWTDPVATVLLRRGPSFDGNRRRLCKLYRRLGGATERARWPARVERRDGRPSPTEVPALIDGCTI